MRRPTAAPVASVAPLLARLVGAVARASGGRGRFWLLETLRAYAAERLGPPSRWTACAPGTRRDTAERLPSSRAGSCGPTGRPEAVSQ